MAGSIVQSRETSVGAISGTTIALAFSSNNTLHNALYVVAHVGDNASTPTIADSLTNSYSANLDNTVDNDDNNDISHWAVADSKAGANTVTVSFASAPWRMIYIAELTGVQNVAVDAHKGLHQTAPGTGANAVSSGTAATSATDFLIGVSSQDHNTGNAATVGSGFTLDKNGWNASGSNQMTAEVQAGVASGTRGATWTAANATDNLTNVFAAFKESGGGGAATQPMLTMLGVGP